MTFVTIFKMYFYDRFECIELYPWFLILILGPKVRHPSVGVQGELLQPLHNLLEFDVDVRVDRDV